MVACDYVGIVSAKKQPDKFEKAGFTATKSHFVNAPVINELPLALECEVESYDTDSEILIGKIVNVCADEEVLGADNLPDLSKLQPIAFDIAHSKYLSMGEVVGSAFSDGKKLK